MLAKACQSFISIERVPRPFFDGSERRARRRRRQAGSCCVHRPMITRDAAHKTPADLTYEVETLVFDRECASWSHPTTGLRPKMGMNIFVRTGRAAASRQNAGAHPLDSEAIHKRPGDFASADFKDSDASCPDVFVTEYASSSMACRGGALISPARPLIERTQQTPQQDGPPAGKCPSESRNQNDVSLRLTSNVARLLAVR